MTTHHHLILKTLGRLNENERLMIYGKLFMNGETVESMAERTEKYGNVFLMAAFKWDKKAIYYGRLHHKIKEIYEEEQGRLRC